MARTIDLAQIDGQDGAIAPDGVFHPSDEQHVRQLLLSRQLDVIQVFRALGDGKGNISKAQFARGLKELSALDHKAFDDISASRAGAGNLASGGDSAFSFQQLQQQLQQALLAVRPAEGKPDAPSRPQLYREPAAFEEGERSASVGSGLRAGGSMRRMRSTDDTGERSASVGSSRGSPAHSRLYSASTSASRGWRPLDSPAPSEESSLSCGGAGRSPPPRSPPPRLSGQISPATSPQSPGRKPSPWALDNTARIASYTNPCSKTTSDARLGTPGPGAYCHDMNASSSPFDSPMSRRRSRGTSSTVQMQHAFDAFDSGR